MKLSVIIVSYNVRYYLEQCIHSVLKAVEGLDAEVFVVDNDSSDGTVDYLHQRFGSQIRLIESVHNLGFARANNIAVKQSSGQYVLLLNPDTFVGEGSLRAVVDFMDAHPQAGGAGVRMYDAMGRVARESRRGLPTPWVSLLKMLGFSRRYYMSDLSWDEPGRIQVMSGAFMMLRREAIDKVGLLDEDFFMYGEDIDLSYRILKGGYENWYVPVSIVHYKGESTQKSSYRYVHVFYEAMLIFFRKHYGHLSFFVTAPIKIAIYARAFLALVQMGCHRLNRSLGFASKSAHSVMKIHFVGSPQMLAECRDISLRRGLDATFAAEMELKSVPPCDIIVYDTSVFTYDAIIRYAASFVKSDIELATYSTVTHRIITIGEVIA